MSETTNENQSEEIAKAKRQRRETRLRRLASRLGYRLSKSSTRLRYLKDFGRYTLIYYVRVPRYVEVSQARYLDSTSEPSRYLTLDDVEDYLADKDRDNWEDEDEDEDEDENEDEGEDEDEKPISRLRRAAKRNRRAKR